jgi:hypothetical protein
MKPRHRIALVAGAALLALTPASANHSWGNYHWATMGHGLDVTVVYSVTPKWTTYVNGAVADWEKSRKLSLTTADGDSSDLARRRCEPIPGKTRVCNAAYGQRPWVGLATIWLSGDHITQAVTQLNDSYFDTYAFYNTPAWRAFVACQEVGHDWGLDHQDENFDNYNLGTCMDYTRAPQGGVYNGFDYGPSNVHTNDHDYEQLTAIYSHNDGFTTASQGTNFGVRQVGQRPLSTEPAGTSPAEWGSAIRRDSLGRPNVFVKDLGAGQKKLTHVLWAVDANVR